MLQLVIRSGHAFGLEGFGRSQFFPCQLIETVNMATCTLRFLEIKNFKSYFGFHQIGPLDRFSVIVGPNGSGKSNLMDALCFVLGERSSNMRVKRLADLIHGPPADGEVVDETAEVSALFEVEEGTLKKFTRRIATSSSEYEIDEEGASCQEYLQELEKLGINVKAKNFHTYQGQIEDVALRNPKELAQLFEEMSGSSAFKAEYDELSTQLSAAQNQMSDLSLASKEVEAAKQAAMSDIKEVEAYNKLCDLLKNKKYSLYLLQLYVCKKYLDTTIEELTVKEDEKQVLDQQKAKLQEQLSSHKEMHTQLVNNASQCEMDIVHYESDYRTKQSTMAKLIGKIDFQEKKLLGSRNLRDRAIAERNHSHEEHRNLSNELRTLSEAVEEDPNIEVTDEVVREYHTLKEQSKQLSSKLYQGLEVLLEEEIADRNKSENNARILRKAADRLNICKNELEQQKEKHIRYEKVIEDLKNQLAAARSDEKALTDKLESMKMRKDELLKQQNEVAETLKGVEDWQQMQAFDRKRAEALAKLMERFPGVYGRVGDLYELRQSKHRVAVDRVLGAKKMNIVVDNELTAMACVNYLLVNKMGRETFIPLATVKATELRPLLRTTRNVYLLIDVIRFEEQYGKVFRFLLKNSLLCDSDDDAAFIAYRHDTEPHDVVSLSGRYFKKNGEVSGNFSNGAPVWSKDQQLIDKAMRKKAQIEQELKDLDVEAAEVELKMLRARIEGLKNRHAVATADEGKTANSIREIEENLKNLQEDHDEALNLSAATESSRADRARKIQRKQQRIERDEANVFAEFCRRFNVANARQFETDKLRARENWQKAQREKEVLIKQIEQQLKFIESKQEPGEANITRWEKAVQEDQEQFDKLIEDKLKLSNEIEVVKMKIEETQAQLASCKQDFSLIEEDITQDRRDVGTTLKRLSGIDIEIAALKAKIYVKKYERHVALVRAKMDGINLPLLNGDMNGVDESVYSSSLSTFGTDSSSLSTLIRGSNTQMDSEVLYQTEAEIEIDFSGLSKKLLRCSYTELEEVISEVRDDVHDLIRKIEEIRAPNAKARMNYATVREKERTLNDEMRVASQRLKQLRKAFEETKQNRLRLFNECFEHVSAQIDPAYKALTGNDSAQAFLIAENSEEPYLGGLTYNCVAPGKKFQLMSCLSGGEKSMAALALLMAIHSRRSSPFLVLDEIDAALDAANVNKVADFLRLRKNDVQIVLITLKHAVTSRGDILLGVHPDPLDNSLKSKVAIVPLYEYSDHPEDDQ